MSLLVHRVVGEFDFLEGDLVLHPLCSSGRGIRMSVDPGRPLGFGFAGSEPSGVETESGIIREDQIQEDEVLGVGIQAAQAHFESGEHPPAQFGDDHLRADLMELLPELHVLQ